MAIHRKAGARALARLAACACLFVPLYAQAADVPAPFVEYEAEGRWSTAASEAAVWQMLALCAYEGQHSCVMGSVFTHSTGYSYHYTHQLQRPGGAWETRDASGGGGGAYSCPAGSQVYTLFFGMEVGPYPNRVIDLGGPYPVVCKTADGLRAMSALGTVPPVVNDTFDGAGRLSARVAEVGARPAAWRVVWHDGGEDVTADVDDRQSRYVVDGDRVVSFGGGVSLEYADDGGLKAVVAANGDRVERGAIHDPDGRLVALLRAARANLPAVPGAEPLGVLVRLGESIDALLGGAPDPHARVD